LSWNLDFELTKLPKVIIKRTRNKNKLASSSLPDKEDIKSINTNNLSFIDSLKSRLAKDIPTKSQIPSWMRDFNRSFHNNSNNAKWKIPCPNPKEVKNLWETPALSTPSKVSKVDILSDTTSKMKVIYKDFNYKTKRRNYYSRK